jgi:hypothetical protein
MLPSVANTRGDSFKQPIFQHYLGLAILMVFAKNVNTKDKIGSLQFLLFGKTLTKHLNVRFKRTSKRFL